jgi:cytochrome c-type biogenesis protein CcmH/NrfG
MGNKFFKEKHFDKALEAYSQAAVGSGSMTDRALALANR